MWSENEASQAIGKTVYSGEGEKIGKVGQVFLDDQTGRPEFITVNTGLFGSSESFVPVEGASINGDDISVPYGKETVKDAPRVDIDEGHLAESDERRLYEHYGRGYDNGQGSGNGSPAGYAGDQDLTGHDAGHQEAGRQDAGDRDMAYAGHQQSAGHDTSGPNTDDAMTRSEEHLDVGTTSQAAGRARLRKYVTTENESVTVPVKKEKAVLETEPVTAANVDDATEGPGISEEEHEVVLNEERVVVDKTVEPVERVRLGTETVTEEQTVDDEVRKEHIEVEGDVDQRR
jgi:uncharacterized protein (TIGR02271 family)